MVVSSRESSDSEPQRPVRPVHAKRRTVAAESQHWQIETGLIPDPIPAARTKARALNAKKKKKAQTSQLENEFRLSK